MLQTEATFVILSVVAKTVQYPADVLLESAIYKRNELQEYVKGNDNDGNGFSCTECHLDGRACHPLEPCHGEHVIWFQSQYAVGRQLLAVRENIGASAAFVLEAIGY
jgi:hypothetical protein